MRTPSPFERLSEFVPEEDARLNVHVMVEGETLPGLAHKYYGDWRLWTLVADRNEIIDARRVEPGTQLLIPARSPGSGRFESL